MAREDDDPGYALSFGWEGDGGLGARLVRQVLEGRKTATCAPVALLSREEMDGPRRALGKVVPLTDAAGNVHGRVRILDVFETTYGDPDERLWRGEGYDSADAFKRSHARVWDAFWPPGESLRDDTVLFVEVFQLEKG